MPEKVRVQNQDKYLSIKEVIEITGMKKSFIYREAKIGGFPKQVKIGSASRWLESEVKKWASSLSCKEAA